MTSKIPSSFRFPIMAQKLTANLTQVNNWNFRMFVLNYGEGRTKYLAPEVNTFIRHQHFQVRHITEVAGFKLDYEISRTQKLLTSLYY